MLDPFVFLYFIDLFICFIIGLICINAFYGSFRVFFFQVAIALANEIVGYSLFVKDRHANNTWLYNLYGFVEIWLTAIALQMLIKTERSKIFTGIALAAYTAICIYFVIFDNPFLFASYPYLAGGVLVSIMSFMVVIHLLQKTSLRNIPLNILLVICGILIYHCCTIPMFAMMNFTNQNQKSIASKLYHIVPVLAMMKYILYTLAFLLCRRNFKRTTQAQIIHDRP